MMITKVDFVVRPASLKDRKQLAALIHFEPYVHRHLDWRSTLDWLGNQPYLVVEQNERLLAALACPLEPPETAWIRMFATAGTLSAYRAWNLLWPQAEAQLRQEGCTGAAAIPMRPWFRDLLMHSGFEHTHDVIMLIWEKETPPPLNEPPPVRIRAMTPEDIPVVQTVDNLAFSPIWRNSRTSLELAFQQSVSATVAEDEEGLVGYQISTSSPLGAHLARLAVHPRAQNRGIGYALVRDLLTQFVRRGVSRITVNTQHDNYSSLALYAKAGFHRTSEAYPVYQRQFD